MSKIENSKKQEKAQQNESNEKILKKNQEIYDLFIKADSEAEIERIERWLLR